jgi:hypothetical protein
MIQGLVYFKHLVNDVFDFAKFEEKAQSLKEKQAKHWEINLGFITTFGISFLAARQSGNSKSNS